MTDEVDQQVVIFPAKAEDISSVIGAHILEGERTTLFYCIQSGACYVYTNTYTHVCMHVHI